MSEVAATQLGPMPVGPTARRGMGWWGVWMLVASEAALFGYLLFSYYYVGATQPPGWVLDTAPRLTLALPNTALLLLSSVAAWYGERNTRGGRRAGALAGFGIAFLLGVMFVMIQAVEWSSKPYHPGLSGYASLYFVTTAFHIWHVAVGLLVLLGLFLWTALGYFGPRRHLAVSAGVLYWHFVDAVWITVFTTYYITPYLGFGR